MPPFLKKVYPITDLELDGNQHVNNIEFVKWMQDVAIQHASDCGCDNELYKRLSVSWVARSHHIDYIQSAFEGDTVVAVTWIANSRKVGCKRKYVFHRNSLDGDLLARAETHWVFVDFESGRPRKIPTEVLDCFEQLGEEPNLDLFD